MSVLKYCSVNCIIQLGLKRFEFGMKANEDTGEEFLKKEGDWRRNTSSTARLPRNKTDRTRTILILTDTPV